eukprot:gene35796-44143_t
MNHTLPPDALMRASRAEYARRMNRVLDYIDQHLDAPLDLDSKIGSFKAGNEADFI